MTNPITNTLLVFSNATSERVDRMLPFLENEDPEALKLAITELVKTQKYLPSVSEILAVIGRCPRKDELRKQLLNLELRFYQTEKLEPREWKDLVEKAKAANRPEFAEYVDRRYNRFQDVLTGVYSWRPWTQAEIEKAGSAVW
jgi:hypothetical protein